MTDRRQGHYNPFSPVTVYRRLNRLGRRLPVRFFRRRRTQVHPDDELRAWRLAANRFYVEAAECREGLRLLKARARDGVGRAEVVDAVLRERARIADACGELVSGFEQLRKRMRDAAEADCARERDAVRGFRRRVGVYVRRRTRHVEERGNGGA